MMDARTAVPMVVETDAHWALRTAGTKVWKSVPLLVVRKVDLLDSLKAEPMAVMREHWKAERRVVSMVTLSAAKLAR